MPTLTTAQPAVPPDGTANDARRSAWNRYTRAAVTRYDHPLGGVLFATLIVLGAGWLLVYLARAVFVVDGGVSVADRLGLLITIALTVFFPISALAYRVYQSPQQRRLLLRDWELLRLYDVSDVDTARPDGVPRASHDIEKLYERTYGLSNYIVQTTLAVIITVIGASFFFWPPEVADNALLDVNTLQAMRYGFLGAYLFVLLLVYRRYTTLDLQPSVYTYGALTLIAGLTFNYVAFEALAALSAADAAEPATGLAGGLLAIVAFSLGYFPQLAIRWFSRVAYTTLGEPSRRSDALPLSLIDGISHLHEVRLRDEGIDNIQNLAAAPIIDLLVKTRFGAEELIEWVDQAVLYLYLEPGEIEAFRRAGIRSCTDFRDQWGAYYLPPAPPPAGDRSSQLDARVKALTEAATRATQAEATRKTKALLFQSLPERLDAIYSGLRRGPNVDLIDTYWHNLRETADVAARRLEQALQQVVALVEKVALGQTPATEALAAAEQTLRAMPEMADWPGWTPPAPAPEMAPTEAAYHRSDGGPIAVAEEIEAQHAYAQALSAIGAAQYGLALDLFDQAFKARPTVTLGQAILDETLSLLAAPEHADGIDRALREQALALAETVHAEIGWHSLDALVGLAQLQLAVARAEDPRQALDLLASAEATLRTIVETVDSPAAAAAAMLLADVSAEQQRIAGT